MDADPAQRNIFGVWRGQPASWPATASGCARSARRSSKCSAASASIRRGSCPAASAAPLTVEKREADSGHAPRSAANHAPHAWTGSSSVMDRFQDEIASFANFPTLFMGLVDEDGTLEYLRRRAAHRRPDGKHRRRRARRQRLSGVHRRSRRALDSYLKSPYYKPMGYPNGHLPRRPAGAPEHRRPRAARRWPTRSSPSSVHGWHRAKLVPLSLCAADRNPLLLRAHRASC